MKTTLKWIGWGVLAVIAAIGFHNATEVVQVGLMLFAGIAYLSHSSAKQVEAMHRDTQNRLERLSERLEHVAQECYALDRKLSALRELNPPSRM